MRTKEQRRLDRQRKHRYHAEQKKALATAKIPDGLYLLKIVNYEQEYTFTARPDQYIDGLKVHTIWVLADPQSRVPPGPIGEIISVERIGE